LKAPISPTGLAVRIGGWANVAFRKSGQQDGNGWSRPSLHSQAAAGMLAAASGTTSMNSPG